MIGVRSFGDDPNCVASCCLAFVKGAKEHGIICVGKHFPGHGDTSKDSHKCLPMVDKTEKELQKCEFIPFKSLIDENIDMIMTAHILLPKIDGKYPATLSEKILNDILRKELGYNGVIITDAMDMRAIADNFGDLDAAKQAAQAGADILLMPTTLRGKEDVYKLKELYSYLQDEIEADSEFKRRIDESVVRILKLESSYLMKAKP